MNDRRPGRIAPWTCCVVLLLSTTFVVHLVASVTRARLRPEKTATHAGVTEGPSVPFVPSEQQAEVAGRSRR